LPHTNGLYIIEQILLLAPGVLALVVSSRCPWRCGIWTRGRRAPRDALVWAQMMALSPVLILVDLYPRVADTGRRLGVHRLIWHARHRAHRPTAAVSDHATVRRDPYLGDCR